MKIADVRIGKRIRQRLVGIDELAENIKEVGLIHPISVDSEKNLLCGLRRLEACKLLGWSEIEEKVFPLDVEADENLFRQEFNPEEKVRGLGRIDEREKQKARGRMRAGKPSPKLGKGRATITVAQKVGWGHTTYEKAKAVIASKQSKLIRQMNTTGNVSAAYRRLKQKEDENRIKKEAPKKVIEGKFKTILLDPPWDYKNLNLQSKNDTDGGIIPDYKPMSLSEIGNIHPELVADKDCHLYLWTTNNFIYEALKLIEFWGFSYKTLITWI